jgi:hypothetical protein
MLVVKAEIYKAGYNYSVDIRIDLDEFPQKSGYIQVKGIIKGIEFKATLIPRKDNFYSMFLNSEIRSKALLKTGDVIEIAIEFDPDSREIRIPEDLEVILKENEENWQKFINLSSSHRREMLQFLSDAKKVETRVNRINKIIYFLNQRSR